MPDCVTCNNFWQGICKKELKRCAHFEEAKVKSS